MKDFDHVQPGILHHPLYIRSVEYVFLVSGRAQLLLWARSENRLRAIWDVHAMIDNTIVWPSYG